MKRTLIYHLMGLSVLCWITATAKGIPAWRWSGVDRIVSVGDVHGAYEPLVATLQAASVLDDALHWNGGSAHFVSVGDLLDRGAESRKVMDLIMRLQREAAEAGGAVHLVLGNHEMMNLVGDLAHVAKAEYAAFADEESPEARELAFQSFLAKKTAVVDESEAASESRAMDGPAAVVELPAVDGNAAREEFDKRYPPGFFSHRAAFGPTGKYGSWLLQQPLVIVINDTAFVHGGLSDAVVKLGPEGINRQLGSQLSRYVNALATLVSNGILDSTDDFYDQAKILAEYRERVAVGDAVWPADAAAAADTVIDLNAGLFIDTKSPTSYRGTVSCGPLIEADRLQAALNKLGARRVVVGHTPTLSGDMVSHLDGQVLRVDSGMLSAVYRGRAVALIIKGDRISAVYEDGEEATLLNQPRRVGVRPGILSVEQLEQILASGELVPGAGSEQSDGSTLVTLQSDGFDIVGRFKRALGRGRGPFLEVAAYRLDRLLGLDMVPVTVLREVDGKRGSIQLVPPLTVNETERSAQGMGAGAWCPLKDQLAAMYVFDVLIFNEGRTSESILYSKDNWQLILIGHSRAFEVKRGRPGHLKNIELALTGEWVDRLRVLDQAGLEQALGDVLDKKRIKALLQRRDELVGAASMPR